MDSYQIKATISKDDESFKELFVLKSYRGIENIVSFIINQDR